MRFILGMMFILVPLLGTAPVAAQQVEDYVEITMKDGSVFVGHVISETDTEVIFKTGAGLELIIQVSDIRSRKVIRGRTGAKGLVKLDPTSSRLFFTASARPVEAGRAYISSYEVFFTFFAAGVTDNLTLAGGVSLFPFSSEQLFYIAPKYTLYNKNDRSFAVGVLAGGLLGKNEMGGLLYGVTTIGPPDKALTAGAGFLFGGGEISSTPIVMIGGEKQISSRLKLISENYILPVGSTEVVLSGGIRIIGGSLTTDLAFVTVVSILDEGGFPFIPWLSFTYNFGF